MTQTSAAILRISDPRELLAYVPYQLGFHPRDSLVLIGLRGHGLPVGMTIRIDLTAFEDAENAQQVTAELIDLLERDGAVDAVGVIYSDRDRSELLDEPAVLNLLAELRGARDWIDPPGPWVVCPRGYGPWGGHPRCAEPMGSVGDLDTSAMAATMVVAGRSIAPDRQSIMPAVEPDERRRTRAADAAAVVSRTLEELADAAGGSGDHEDLVAWRHDAWRDWVAARARVIETGELPPDVLGRIAAALADARFRDAVIASFVLPHEDEMPSEAQIDAATRDACRIGGVTPDPRLVSASDAVLSAVVSHMPEDVVEAAAALAWLAWWCGDGARANVLLARCLEIAPGHGLSDVLAQALSLGVSPGWAAH